MAAVFELHFALGGIDAGNTRIQFQVDALIAVELGRAQRDPLLGRTAGQVVLRQVGSIAGQRVVGTEQRDLAVELFAPQHLGCGVARRATADDDDGPG